MEDGTSKLTPAPNSTEPDLPAVLAGISRSSHTVPLSQMEYVEQPNSSWRWSKNNPLLSPRLLVQLKVHVAS